MELYPHQCAYCPRMFTQLPGLHDHMHEAHTTSPATLAIAAVPGVKNTVVGFDGDLPDKKGVTFADGAPCGTCGRKKKKNFCCSCHNESLARQASVRRRRAQ